MNLNQNRVVSLSAWVIAASLTTSAMAVNFEWDGGAGDNLWDSMTGPATNWIPESTPASPDNIVLTNLSLAGPVTIDLNGPRFVNRIEVDGVDGAYTFDNTGSGSLEIFLGLGNALLNESALSTLIVDADISLQSATEQRFNSFDPARNAGRVIVNGDVTTGAASGTTNLVLTSNNITLDRVIQVHGVISDGPTANMALTAGFGGDHANHRGVVQVTGANTFTGPTRVNGAILEFNSIANVGGAPNALGQPVLADSTISVGIGTTTGFLRYTGTAGAGHASDRVINMAGTSGGAGIDASGAGPLVLSGGITATTNGSKTLTLTGNNTDENTLAGVITDVAGGDVHITKSGAGTWVLTGANQAAGNHNINQGELILRGAGSRISALGAFANTVVRINNDATFTLEGGTVTAREMDRGAAATFNFKSGTVNLSAGTSTFNADSGPVNIGTDGNGILNLNGTAAQFNGGVEIQGSGDELNLTAGSISTTSLDNSNGGAFNFTGGSVVITGGQITTAAGSFNGGVSGSGGITKIGGGTLTLNATNSYTGVTSIDEGTLKLGPGGLDHFSASTVVDVAAGATLDLVGSNGEALGGLTGSGTVITGAGADIVPGQNNQNTTFSGTITGTGNLTKTGTGILTLTNNHTYSGLTTVNAAGTLKLGAGDTLPDLTRVTLSVSGATLDLDNADEEIGGLSGVAGSIVSLGTATLTTGSNNETLNFDGNITGTGGLTKVGNGTQRLRAFNSFTGDINVNDGTLEIGANNTIGNNAVIVASGATLRVAGDAESFGSLAGAGTVVSAVNTSVGVNPGHNNTDTTFSGDITGIGPFVKSGTGTMTMTGLSDYTGRTRVDNGELVFDGASSGLTQTNGIVLNGGDVTVKNGASLNSVGSTGFIHLDTPATTLTIESGGSATSASHTSLGETSGAFGQLRVTGVGSKLETLSTSRVRVGNNGVGQLIVDDGGTVDTHLLAISDSGAGSAGSNAIIEGFLNNGLNGIFGDDDDEVSVVNATSRVFVGDVAKGSLTIQNGGRVVSGTSSNNHLANQSHIGAFTPTDGSIATITGNQSRWVHNGHLEIARFGGDATNPVELRVLDGGYAEFSFIFTTPNDGSRSKITVDGTDSKLKVRDARGDPGVVSPGFGDIRMVPANSNGVSEIFVTDGGLLDIDTRLAIGQGTADFGGQAHVTVDGADSTLNAGNELIVALSGTTASLTITDGGTVNSGTDDTVASPVRDSFISHTSGSGTANVGAEAGMDAGHAEAAWNIDGNLYIAGNQASDNNGNAGVLNINPTGRVSVAGQVRVWDTGTINLNGGTLEVDSINLDDEGDTPGTPTLHFNSGTLRLTTSPEATLDATVLSQTLGANPTLTAGQELAVENTAIITATLRNNGGTFTVGEMDTASAANFDFDAGTLNLTQSDLVIGASGIFGSEVILDSDQAINVTQNATIEADGRLIVAGGFSSALLTNHNELIAVDTVINGPVTTPAGSTVTVIGTVEFNDLVSGAGEFFGPGTAVFNGGQVVGDSPAAVGFEGSVGYGANSALFIEVGGTTPGDEHDQVNITGHTALDGTLDLDFINGFTPAYGDTFDILTYATRSGVFQQVTGHFISPVLALGQFYDDANGVLQLLATAPGDANGDLIVDISDFGMLAGNINQPGTWETGDFNGDGITNINDFGLLAANFNGDFNTLMAAAAELGITTIPEPGTATLVMGAALLGVLPGRNRARRARLG